MIEFVNVVSLFSCCWFRWVKLPSCCFGFLFKASWLSKFTKKITTMFQLGLFLVILTSLVMLHTQTLITLSWSTRSFVLVGFVSNPLYLFINLAYRNLIASCKLLLSGTNNWSLGPFLGFLRSFECECWVWVCFQEQGVFHMLMSSWLKFKCLN